jgi:hypothetical protein
MSEDSNPWHFLRMAENESVSKGIFHSHDRVLKMSEAFDLLSGSEPFRTHFIESLLLGSSEAFFWEMPPISTSSLDSPFEFVQTNAPTLAGIRANPEPFSNRFATGGSSAVLSFENLGGDALLIVPSPVSKENCYGHLASFLRSAPVGQIHLFWKTAADSIRNRISSAPFWLSTAGLGVSWLHLRLDTRPKYFRYEPYKNPDFISKIQIR